MPDKNVTIGLSFSADTSKARQEIDKLKNDLSKIISSANIGQQNSSQFNQVINQAAQLRGILEKATSATGKLDLSKFERGLKTANIDLKTMAQEFQKIDGGQFFNNLTQQVMAADTKINILSGTLKKFAQGLMNTAMWTIQSNAIHAVESALSSAYGYAQKLNKGLTDIAIVSDLNTQQLTEFARTANQMAKDLSASTNDVVSGALIYYQAGLSDEEVIKRTETTIKLAQTSGESAEQISSYMTAIWNNFYDGSKSVEYYADVISYLGAVTAASNADIAEGMQSFSAVAGTVGLDFEDAAAAMTLLRDVTQQSASTIGNSLKTIFARLSSLKMGETLEDGVDLTKYTKALESVGVEVLDANGNLRDMSDIIRSLAENWGSLDRAQKDALAQTVGGVRQYNNLITLMDNFDKFEELVAGSKGSDGYLQNQADEYADSWEAARNRLEAAWQGIYDQLIDEKFFIKLTDFLTGIVNFISQIIDGAGGLKGVISMLVMGISSLNVDSFAQKIREVSETLLLIKDAITGVQQQANIDLKGNFLDTLFTTQNTTDNEQIMRLYDDQVALLEKINILKANGQEQEAAYLTEILNRRSAEIQQLIEKDKELQNIRSTIEQIQEISDVPDSKIAGISKEAINVAQLTRFKKDLQNTKSGEDLVQLQDKYVNNMTASGIIQNSLYGGKKEDSLKEIDRQIEREIGGIIARTKDVFKEAKSSDNIDVVKEVLGINDQDSGSMDAAIDKIKGGMDELKVARTEASEAGLAAESQTVVTLTEQEKLYSSLIEKILKEAELTEEQRRKLEELQQKIATPSTDWAAMTTSGIRAASALTAMSSGMEGLVKSIKDGNISIGSLVGSIGSIWRGATTASDALTTMAEGIKGTSAASKAFSSVLSFLGGNIWWLIGIVAALTAAFYLFKKAQENAYNASIEGRIEANNNALEKQKEIVSNLVNEYENLQSTINNLNSEYENLNEMQKGSAEYLIALQKYQLEIAKLKQEYGDDVVKIDEFTGQEIVDQEKLNEIMLERLTIARAEQQVLENNAQKLKTEQVKNDIINSKNTKDGVETLDGGSLGKAYKIAGENDTFATLTEADFNSIWGRIEQLLNSEDLNSSNFEEKFKEALGTHTEEAVYNYFLKKVQAYQDALNSEEQNTKDFADLSRNSLASMDVYSAGAEFGVKDEIIDSALNKYASNFEISEDDQQAALQRYAEQHDMEVSDISEDLKAQIIEAAINGSALANLLNMDPQEIVETLQKNLSDDDLAKIPDDYFEALENKIAQSKRVQELIDQAVNEHGFEKDEFVELMEYIEDHWRDLNLPEDIANDRAAIAELTDDILRFNRAIEDVSENYDDWKQTLESGTVMDQAQAFKDMRDAYGDLLDLNPDSFSEGFLRSAENLDLMKESIQGNEEAYQELLDIAEQDIETNLGINDASLAQFNTTLDQVRAQINNGIDDIEVGAYIDDTQAIEAMNQLINAADMTAQQATDLLASMGVDAEVEEKTIKKEDKKEFVGAIPSVTDIPIHGTTVLPDGSPSAWTGSTPQIQYKADKVPEVEEGENTVTALRVTSARKSSGGGFKYKHSTNGAGNKGAGNKGKGGGGGSEKKITPKEKGTQRYHEVTAQLKQNKAELDKLNKAKDRAFGQGRIDYMKEEIELLKQQAEYYERLAKEANGYLAQDQKVLLGYGAQFNDDGTIKNFESWYDSWVDKYNSGSVDDDWWKKFEDAIKKYETALDKVDEAEKGRMEALNKIYDERLEIVTYKVEYLNKLIEAGTKYLDFLIKQADKSLYDIGEKVGLIGQKAKNALQEVANIQNGIIEMLSNENHPDLTPQVVQDYLNGNLSLEEMMDKIGQMTDKEKEQLLKYREELLKWAETLNELREEAYDQLTESLEKFNDEIEHQKDIISQLGDVMKNYRNIIDLVGKDILGVSDDLLKQMNKVSLESAEKNLDISKKQYNEILREYERLKAEYESMLANPEIGEEDRRNMKKQVDNYYDALLEAQNEYLEREQEALEKAVDNFKDNMQMIADAFDKAVSGTAGSLANLQEYFDLQNKVDEQYLPTYEQIYNLSKLTRDVNNAINNTDNIKGKERLKKLQNDILKIEREDKKLNEYDVGLLQRRLELEQALIAMEEARDAKNMVRMTRDNEGNWSYTYTQNPEDAEKARQDYEDKLYNLEKWNQDQVKAMQSAYLQQLQDYTNYINGLDITDEERNKRIGEKQKQLQEIYGEFLGQAIEDGQWITDEYGVQSHELVDHFAETTLALEGNFDSLNEMLDTFRINSLMADAEITASFEAWYEDRERILALAEQSTDSFANIVEEDLGKVSDAMDDAADAAEDMSKDMGTEFDEILTNLKNMFYGEKGMSKTIDDIIGKFKTWQQTIIDLISKIGELNNTKVNISVPSAPSGGGSGGGGSSSGNSSGSSGGGGSGNTVTTVTTVKKETTVETQKTSKAHPTIGGCFDAGTKIIMADGTIKNIEDIQIGNMVIAYNEINEIFEPKKVTKSYIHINTPTMVDITLSNGIILHSTPGHPLLSTKGWKSLDIENSRYEHNTIATLLKIGDEIIGINGNTKIVDIKWRKNLNNYNTYNIEVETCHTFLAEGLVVHNMKVTQKDAIFDTGGYTGNWGPEGRQAILHEKELVLNKKDTANMLATVGFVRDLVEMIGVNATSSAGIGNLLLGGVVSGGNYLDQNVNIHAEFPNATNHSEIEEAFQNLIGLAGQYAGRK